MKSQLFHIEEWMLKNGGHGQAEKIMPTFFKKHYGCIKAL
jgi:hypothetical protein